MFDAMKLLGSIAESQSAPSAGNRFGGAVQQGASGGGPLQQLLGQLGGGTTAGGGAQAGGGLNSLLGGLMGQGGVPGSSGPAAAQGGLGGVLGSFAEMAKRAASSPGQAIESNNPVAVGGLGSLAGALLGGGRGAMGGGLMAMLGSLAVSALQGQGVAGGTNTAPAATRPSAGPGPGQMGAAGTGGMAAATAFAAPSSQADAQRKAVVIIRAMIQAAKADGQVDQQEMQRIMGKLDEHGHGAEARDFVMSELRRPVDIGGLVRDVTTPQEAVEVYGASLMAIEVDTQIERDYLNDLAASLRLPQPVVARINSALGVAV